MRIESTLTRCRNWLENLLSSGPMQRQDILSAAEEAGFHPTTIARAARSMPNLHSERAGFPLRSTWSLITDNDK